MKRKRKFSLVGVSGSVLVKAPFLFIIDYLSESESEEPPPV